MKYRDHRAVLLGQPTGFLLFGYHTDLVTSVWQNVSVTLILVLGIVNPAIVAFSQTVNKLRLIQFRQSMIY